MHYEQHIQKINELLNNPTSDTVGSTASDLSDLRDKTNEILQSINDRNGKIISVVPITKGYFDFDYDNGYDYDDNIYGYGYGWGASFTRALLYIVEYPD